MGAGAAVAAGFAGGGLIAVLPRITFGGWPLVFLLLAAIPLLAGVVAACRFPVLGFTMSGFFAAAGIAVAVGIRTISSDGDEIGAGNAFWEGAVLGAVPGIVAVVLVALIRRGTTTPS